MGQMRERWETFELYGVQKRRGVKDGKVKGRRRKREIGVQKLAMRNLSGLQG